MRNFVDPLFPVRAPIPVAVVRSMAVGSFLLILAVWAVISHQPWVDPVFVPTPQRVFEQAQSILVSAMFWSDVQASFLRVTYGVLLSAALAVPLGLFMGSFRIVEGFLQPMTEFVRYLPVPALIPVLMIVLGIGEMSKVGLIFIGTYFQLVLMVADAARAVPNDLLETSYTLGAKRMSVIRRVILPSAMPTIADALRLCNGWAWTYVIVAELVAANEGLGYRILKFSRFLQTPKIWVYLLVLGVIGLVLDMILRRINRRVFHWSEAYRV